MPGTRLLSILPPVPKGTLPPLSRTSSAEFPVHILHQNPDPTCLGAQFTAFETIMVQISPAS